MKRVTIWVAGMVILSVTMSGARPTAILPVPADESTGIGLSMTHEVNAAIDRALDWLAVQQKESGAWSNEQFPALTALPAWAFIRSSHARRAHTVPGSLAFLQSCVQPDGGIYRPVAGRRGGGA